MPRTTDKDKKKRHARRRLVYGKIGFISLCPRGASTLQVVYKEDSDDFELQMLTKETMTELGEIHCCVYAPEVVDSHLDMANQAVIKQIAHDFLKNGGEIDLRHDDKPLPRDQAYVAQSFIIQKDDARFADMKDYQGNPVDVTGGWGAVLQVDDPGLRAKYRSGEWNGVSMGGKGRYEDLSIYDPLHKQTNNDPTPQGIATMDEKQITELVLKAATAAVTAAFAKRDEAEKVAKEATEAAKTKTELEDLKKEGAKGNQIEFDGDRNNLDDVKKHLAKVEAAKVDWSDPESVRKHAETLKAGDEGLTEDQRKVKSLEAQIRKIQGGSNQGGSSATPLGGGSESLTDAGFREVAEMHEDLKKEATTPTRGYTVPLSR